MGRLGPGIISSDDTTTPAVATTTEILSTSQGGWGQDISGETGLVFVNAGTPVFISSVVDVAGYATDGDGTSGDPWTGWDTAITWSGSYVYWFRPGHYQFTSTLLLAEDDTHLVGSGMGSTILHFEPTAADTAIEFHHGSSASTRCSLSKLMLQSADTTYKKIAIDLVDVDTFHLADVEVGPDGYWTGATSVGVRVRGRQAVHAERINIFTDLPVQLSVNPNNAIDADHYHLQDCYFIANGNPNVLIDDGVDLTTVTFDGYQAWVKGTHGLYWSDTTTTTVGIGLRLNNVRWEQSESAAGYFVYIDHTGAGSSFWQLKIDNCYNDPISNGIYLRSLRLVECHVWVYPQAGGTALNLDNTVYSISFRNCFVQSGATLTTTGLTKVSDSGQSTLGGLMAPEVLYDVPSASTAAVAMPNTTVSGRLVVPAVATASLPAAASANDGLILIEEAGAGDRNLIIYYGAQRFRIDGGAAF